MNIEHTHRSANPPLGGAAGWGEHTEQLQMFPTPQTEYTSDDYWTPRWIFEILDLTFDLDVASPPDGPKNTPCLSYYTQETNGLTSPWYGRVFMNPPFSKPQPWIMRFLDHANGVGITSASKAKWFDYLWRQVEGIVFLPATLKYESPTQTNGSIFMPSVIFACGKENLQAIAKLGRVR
jgi:phage N-6-adenine-methyltransferase